MPSHIVLSLKPQRYTCEAFFFVNCIMTVVFFLIAIVSILSLIRVYQNRQFDQTVSINILSFNASYLISNGDINSIINIDAARTLQCMRQVLGLSDTDSLSIETISEESIVGSIQCNHGLETHNGSILIFPFTLYFSCQNEICKNNKLTQIYQQFEMNRKLSIELDESTIQLELCSYDLLSSNFSETNARKNVWQFVTNMSSIRFQPISTLTTDGNSIIVSGSSSIFDYPSTSLSTIDVLTQNGNLISSRNLSIPRNFHTLNPVPPTNLSLFAGGINARDGTKLNNAELFNLETSLITSINMPSVRYDHQSIVINSSNKIILIGGTDKKGRVSNSGDVFDRHRFTSVINKMKYGRRYHTLTYLPTINKVLIIGGETTIDGIREILDTVELYDVETNMFESVEDLHMSISRSRHTAIYIPLPYNQVLIIGGTSNGSNALDTYEIFDVSTLSFIKNGTIQSARVGHTATLLKDNMEILIVGGYASDDIMDTYNQPIAPCEIFNMKTMASRIVTNMNAPRALHTAVLLSNTNAVLCCGGVDSNNAALASCERYVY